MRRANSIAAALLFAGLLLSGAFGTAGIGPVGTASASHGVQECRDCPDINETYDELRSAVVYILDQVADEIPHP